MYACNGLSVLCTIMYLSSIPFCDIHVLIFPPYSYTYRSLILYAHQIPIISASRVNSHKAPIHTVTSRTRGMGKGLKAAQPLHFPRGFYMFPVQLLHLQLARGFYTCCAAPLTRLLVTLLGRPIHLAIHITQIIAIQYLISSLIKLNDRCNTKKCVNVVEYL